MTNTKQDGLKLLRKPFEDHQIGKLPKPTRAQTDEVKGDYKKGVRCKICHGWHHPNVIHLDYVGHAALTDRLLDVDPEWYWEPFALTETGLPQFDQIGGLWIKLTVLGVTRLGYGAADNKTGGDAIKEIIGDALRNAAMRFGAALELWHKGDLYSDDTEEQPKEEPPKEQEKPPANLKRLQEDGRGWIASFESPEKAMERIKKTYSLDEVGEALIVDIWHAERSEEQGE